MIGSPWDYSGSKDWWVDTMRDQLDDKPAIRVREPLHVPPWVYFLVIATAIIVAAMYLW